MKAFTFVTLAITMVMGVQGATLEKRCLPNGSNQCDLSGSRNCCSGFCDRPAGWQYGICK